MPRRISQSQLELFVIAYLKRTRSKAVVRRERKYIQKTISLIIAITAESPCCTDDIAVIDLHTPYDNQLTNTTRVLLHGIDRRKYKKSIERTILLLQNILTPPCCENIIVDFSGTALPHSCICDGTLIKFDLVGQSGQGTFSFEFFKGENASISLPPNITGLFNMCVDYTMCSSGFSENSLKIQPKDSLGVNIGLAFHVYYTNAPQCGSDTGYANFNISNVAKFVFDCELVA